MKRIAGTAVIAALLSLSLVGVASAHTVRHDSAVSLHVKKNGQQADSFEGKVISDRPRCERNRKVAIYRRVKGPDVLIGTTTTDADGNYAFVLPGDARSGTYYAVARRKVLRSDAEHRHVCKRAVSNDVTVAGPPAP